MSEKLPIPKKKALITLLIVTLFSIITAIFSWCGFYSIRINFLQLIGLQLQLTGLFQLEVCGFFDRLVGKYSDESKYPFGPPSHISRTIVDDVDSYLFMVMSYHIFQNNKFGFYLIVAGTVIQIFDVFVS